MESVEKRLVSACLKSREAYDKIIKITKDSTLTPYSSLLLKIAQRFYETDPKAQRVDRSYVFESLKTTIDSDKKLQLYDIYAQECFAVDVSSLNVADVLLQSKIKQDAAALAAKLVNNSSADKSVLEALRSHIELVELGVSDEPDDEERGVVLHNVPVSEVNEKALKKEGLIKIVSNRMCEEIDGGLLKGHHVIVFARPETGKTAMLTTIMRSLVRQKLSVLYMGNEDPIIGIVSRFQGCLSKMPKLDRLRDPEAAQKVLEAQGYEYAKFIAIAPGKPDEIEGYIREHKPDAIIVDQIRNLNMGNSTKVEMMEESAKFMRRMAIKHNLLSISATQAGDSAENKLVLTMGDVDFSNTGIPGQADLMIGIGVNAEFEHNHMRMISLCKNKLKGEHTHFPMKINESLSLYEDAV